MKPLIYLAIVGLGLCLALSGCAGSLTDKTEVEEVDGVTCIKVTTSEGGAGITCDWDGARR